VANATTKAKSLKQIEKRAPAEAGCPEHLILALVSQHLDKGSEIV
jgi:hypothetical protein